MNRVIPDILLMAVQRGSPGAEAQGGVGDTLTLSLEGEVRLGDWAVAVRGLQEMIDGLAAELSSEQELVWIVDDLQASSAIATIRGVGPREAVHRVVRGYERVGESLHLNKAIPFGPGVSVPANRVVQLINGNISSVRLETAARDYTVLPSDRRTRESKGDQDPALAPNEAWGMIEGRIQTVTTRGSFRFTIFDSVFDRAVSCYLRPDYPRDEMRDVWDKVACVEGWISRHPDTGRPQTVRRIRSIAVVAAPGDFRSARGVLTFDPHRRPEDEIRRLRDG